MSPRSSLLPSAASITAVLDSLGIEHHEFSVHSLPGTYSNFTHLVKVESEGQVTRKIVLRRYNPENDEEDHDKHACEFRALQILQSYGIPVPPPLLLDEDGSLLGLPGIVTEFVEGAQIEPPTEAPRWGEMAATNARMLARIHQTRFNEADRRVLMDDNVEVAWFINGGKIPDYMRADPDGDTVWHLVNEHWGKWASTESRFAHTDYWSGNILWQGDQISAVVDWEEAGYGHPAADVAYARMEYYLEGLPEAADVFLRVYQTEAGWALHDLALFELAASARVMTDPPGWFTRPHMEERYRQFVAEAKRKLLAGD